ncbi:MAG: hypothetical protein LBH59_08500 [Planctomycetaceae bacterium]|nr:hypothetical protein [Planctomycetaceae bacterium]
MKYSKLTSKKYQKTQFALYKIQPSRNTNICIPKPVWAVGFALEQTLHVVTLAVFSYVDFKVVSA